MDADILIVDDNSFNILALQAVLEGVGEGFQSDTAMNGKQAL